MSSSPSSSSSSEAVAPSEVSPVRLGDGRAVPSGLRPGHGHRQGARLRRRSRSTRWSACRQTAGSDLEVRVGGDPDVRPVKSSSSTRTSRCASAACCRRPARRWCELDSVSPRPTWSAPPGPISCRRSGACSAPWLSCSVCWPGWRGCCGVSGPPADRRARRRIRALARRAPVARHRHGRGPPAAARPGAERRLARHRAGTAAHVRPGDHGRHGRRGRSIVTRRPVLLRALLAALFADRAARDARRPRRRRICRCRSTAWVRCPRRCRSSS